MRLIIYVCVFVWFACEVNAQAQMNRINLYVSQTNLNECLTGIENTFSDCSFIFYPNPSSRFFTLETNNLSGQKELTLTIFNAMGKSILLERFNTKGKTIKTFDLASQAKGLYILVIQGQKEFFKVKFILQ